MIRQACSIESAARTNPKINIIILMNSDKIDLTVNNATKQLYSLKTVLQNFEFYSVADWNSVVENTPLSVEKSNTKEKILSSEHRIHHASDALRLAAIYKLGGITWVNFSE